MKKVTDQPRVVLTLTDSTMGGHKPLSNGPRKSETGRESIQSAVRRLTLSTRTGTLDRKVSCWMSSLNQRHWVLSRTR